jgi:serine phosphatase RsbU (regulator of sigma subunit)
MAEQKSRHGHLDDVGEAAEQLPVEPDHGRGPGGDRQASDPAFAAIFDIAPVMMLLLDNERRVQAINLAARRALADRDREPIGTRFGNMLRCLHSLENPEGCGFGPSCPQCEIRRLVSSTFDTGQTHQAEEASIMVGDAPNLRIHHCLLSTALVDLLRGQEVLVCIEDITERKSAEEELQTNFHIQQAIAQILHASLEPIPIELLLERVLGMLLSVPWIALQSRGSIFLWEPEMERLVMKAQVGLPDELLAECSALPLGKCLCGQAAATGEIVFANREDERHTIRYPGMHAHGHYCVPVISEGQLYGVINVYVSDGHRRKPEEEAFLSAVADVLATTIKRRRAEETLRENQAQLRAAQRIQEHLLPRRPPTVRGLDIAGASYPAEYAAGDHFDYLAMPDDCVGFVIGDVSGHGFASALLMASTSARIRSFSELGMSIDEIMSRVNSALTTETDEGRFVTAFLGCFDPGSYTFTYVNAGHPAGLVLDASGCVRARMESTTLPLAILPDAPFPMGDPVTLHSGDLVLLLTDGLLEASSSDGQMFGIERTLEIVRANRGWRAQQIIESLYQAVCRHSRHGELRDDVTVIVVKFD